MVLLDCESISSARVSISAALGISPPDLVKLIGGPLRGEGEGRQLAQRQAQRALLRRVLGGASAGGLFGGTCWFHFTRAPRAADFKDGLLPTHLLAEQILDTVSDVARGFVTEDRWEAFRLEMEHCSCHWATQYRAKMRPSASGPSGSLIRAEAFNGDGRLWARFFRHPAAVSDVCRCFRHTVGHAIESEVARVGEPTIVKFRTTGCTDEALAMAMLYIRDTALAPARFAGYGYSGDCGGNPVPPNDLLAIEQWQPNMVTREC